MQEKRKKKQEMILLKTQGNETGFAVLKGMMARFKTR